MALVLLKHSTMKTNFTSVPLGVAIAMLFTVNATAISFDLNTEFSGGAAPSGPPPWVEITITDNGAGTVTLKIDNLGLTGTEFNSQTLLNLESAFRGSLTVALSGSSGTFSAATVAQQTGSETSGAGTFKADGDGFFDVSFSYATGGGGAARFGVGESATYTITSSVSGLDATDFNLLSDLGSGSSVWHAAAHVQGVAGNPLATSGWIGDGAVPDGGMTVGLLGMAMAGLSLLRRKMS